MDVQAAPPVIADTAQGRALAGNPPVLGQQVPGMTGGLPAQGGLSVLAQPMAQQLRSYGRGDDTMLVHMTPGEVNSLQGLAMAAGGSLTINPHTGLPEAGWLGKLLPSILGVALAATGIGAPLAAGIVGLGQTALTGDLKKGLMAGLGAFGGASMAGAAGLGGAVSKNAFGVLGDKAGILGSNMGAGAAATGALPAPVPTPTTPPPVAAAPAPGTSAALANNAMAGTNKLIADAGIKAAAEGANVAGQQAAKTGIAGFAQRFGDTARAGLPGGVIGKAAPMLAASGLLNTVSEATTPTGGYTTSTGQIDNSFAGPYRAQDRKPQFAADTKELLGSTKERDYFGVDQPEIYDLQGRVVQPGSGTAPGTMVYQNVLNPKAKKGEYMYSQVGTPYMSGLGGLMDQGYAKGGEVALADGSFVLDARTVSEVGNGSSNAGKDLLRRIGGRPIEGPGDGVSDSIPARIGRDRPARVARDEVVVPAEAVRRIGKGNPKRGADKLYALMDKAHKARKKAKRGQDTGLRRGLA